MKSLILVSLLTFTSLFLSVGCRNSTPGVIIEEVSFKGIKASIEENLSVGTTMEEELFIQNAPPNLADVVITLSGNGAEDFHVDVSPGVSADTYVGSITLVHSLQGKGGTDYNLTATATLNGQSISTPVDIRILSVGSTNTPPTVTITEGNQTIEANTTLTLHAEASDADGDDLRYQWMYGLKNSATPTNGSSTDSFEHNFTQPGVYIVTVTVTDIHDAAQSDSVQVTVTGHQNQPPIAKIGRATEAGTENEQNITTYVGVAVLRLLSDGSYDPDGEIVHCEWRDEENTLLKESNDKYCRLTPYIFDYPGYYKYTLKVTDNEGASDTNVAHITVKPNYVPVAKIEIEGGEHTVEANTTVRFIATASDDDGDEMHYFWKYGLLGTYGTTAAPMALYPDTEVTFDHNFTQVGTYFVDFYVIDSKKAATKAHVEVNVTQPLPEDVVVIGDLMWEDSDHVTGQSHTVTWSEAYNYCADLTLGGYDDWRLPHSTMNDNGFSEISLIRVESDSDTNNTIISPFVPIYHEDRVASWTDEKVNDNSHFANIFQNYIENGDGFPDNDDGVNVRCVRTIGAD